MTLLSSVGGASGPLYGTLFLKAAPALNGKPTSTPPPSPKPLPMVSPAWPRAVRR